MNGNGSIQEFQVFQRMLKHRENKDKELRSQLDELEKEMQSIRHTQSLYMKEHSIPELSPAPLLEYELSLRKKREQALIQWAERNNGILAIKEAKKALVAAGLIKEGQNPHWIMSRIIGEMDCWERVARGKYRLTTFPQSPLLPKTPPPASAH